MGHLIGFLDQQIFKVEICLWVFERWDQGQKLLERYLKDATNYVQKHYICRVL